MTDRRTFLKGVTALPATALMASQPGCTPEAQPPDNPQGEGREWFEELGVRPFVNAAAAYSALGGRNMWPAVVEAIVEPIQGSVRTEASRRTDRV